ncbi:hypothetical protein [Streptomyces lavendofoliae]|uniref:Peptidoglycan binding domain-containing protein n=1 Tax=Streptomyces lavendofoliae TaxID=67314 RepID=A0A918M4S4_9ACTN|nr:hypothetical protein [Streptomyces lavendofoliae]GGU37289.1 hypothetical protein GCM10010274_26030 [Streptomyces lavendofoliae]
MSRETDSSSSGPQGRGGAAYPSGTPPYGSRQYPSLHPTQDAPEEGPGAADAEPGEPRTETTLTTRIRINIPGSRPIPPVVVRKTVTDTDGPAAGAAPAPRPAAERPPVAEAPQPVEEPQAGEKPASDWFAPRKPPAAAPAPAAPAQQPAAAPGRPPADGAPHPQGPNAPRADGPRADAARPHSSLADLAADTAAPGRPAHPSGPTAGPVTGAMGPMTGGAPGPATGGPAAGAPGSLTGGAGQAPWMSDDTAVLTPQQPAPEAGFEPAYEQPYEQGPPAGGHVSGDTLTSGIPVVPPERRGPSPFPVSGPAQVAVDPVHPAFDGPEPAAAPAPPAPAAPAAAAPARPQKKGRSKLVLLGVAAVVLLGVAYGAGLLLNHSDVPKGTTVLGVDIGGGTKEQAVQKLETAFGDGASAPLQLSVGGKKEELAPDKAGLSLDAQETVRAAAGADYNPVSVIGSLFGGERVAQPVILVDEEKLGVALTDLAGTSGSATEGTIRFEPGKAVAVPGKAGKTLDVQRSMISVRDAYRAQVETGKTNPVELPVVTREPTVTQAELDRAMKEFAEPAMSGLVTIQAGGKQIQFGPERSLPKILSMKPVDGRLVEVYDKQAINTLLDGVFEGVMITKGDGKEHEVSADDVAHAMQKALLGKTPAERTETIELNPQG